MEESQFALNAVQIAISKKEPPMRVALDTGAKIATAPISFLADSIFNSAKISLHKLTNYIQLMSFNVPLDLLCEVLDISKNTAELWRKKIFETVNCYQDHLVLSDTIFIDETYLEDYEVEAISKANT